MTEKKKFTTVKVDLETADKIRFLSDVLKQKQTQILKEIVSELFDLTFSFKSCRLQYANTHDILMVHVFGSKLTVCGIADSEKEAYVEGKKALKIPLKAKGKVTTVKCEVSK